MDVLDVHLLDCSEPVCQLVDICLLPPPPVVMTATPSHTHTHTRPSPLSPVLSPSDTSCEPLMPTPRSSSCGPVTSPPGAESRLKLSPLLLADLQISFKRDEWVERVFRVEGKPLCTWMTEEWKQMDSLTCPLLVRYCDTCDPDPFIGSPYCYINPSGKSCGLNSLRRRNEMQGMKSRKG